MSFLDRREAGRRLAQQLRHFRGQDVVLLGVGGGGVVVAHEVADVLRTRLDIAVVCELTVPYQPWLVFGALGEHDVCVLDEDVIARALVSHPEQLAVQREAREQLRRSLTRYRGEGGALALDGATAVIVTDGVTCAAPARVGVAIARARGARRVVVATPLGAPRAVRALRGVADDVVCLETPPLSGSIRPWYRELPAVSDAEVVALLNQRHTGFRPDRAENGSARGESVSTGLSPAGGELTI
ncbi:phosphoribosyltransferase [Nocardia suismassiliense]|uniref:phosphoribosyltransferase n=1 Tax=Nocardia suismassiliense TaxID=2077092 RepID=UPI000D1ECA2A|nr:phosphoribosyltransferase [Nocardia suismassiliense]